MNGDKDCPNSDLVTGFTAYRVAAEKKAIKKAAKKAAEPKDQEEQELLADDEEEDDETRDQEKKAKKEKKQKKESKKKADKKAGTDETGKKGTDGEKKKKPPPPKAPVVDVKNELWPEHPAEKITKKRGKKAAKEEATEPPAGVTKEDKATAKKKRPQRGVKKEGIAPEVIITGEDRGSPARVSEDDELLVVGEKSDPLVKIFLPQGYNTAVITPTKEEVPDADAGEVVHVVHQSQEDLNYWKNVLARMQRVKNWNSLAKMCKSPITGEKNALPDFPPLPDRHADIRMTSDAECLISQQLLDPEFQKQNAEDLFGGRLFAIKSRPDGACFFNSISRLIYGDQNHAVEMRARLVREAVVREDMYMDHE